MWGACLVVATVADVAHMGEVRRLALHRHGRIIRDDGTFNIEAAMHATRFPKDIK